MQLALDAGGQLEFDGTGHFPCMWLSGWPQGQATRALS